MYFLEHIWLIPLFPVTGAFLMLLFGRKLPKAVVSLLCPGLVGVAFVYSLGAVMQLASLPEHRFQTILYTWLPGSLSIWPMGKPRRCRPTGAFCSIRSPR